MAQLMKRKTQRRSKDRQENANSFSLSRTLISALLVITLSTMGYSPAIATPATSPSDTTSATTTTATSTDTETATDQSDEPEPADPSYEDEESEQAEEPASEPAASSSSSTQTTTTTTTETAQEPAEEAKTLETTIKTASGTYYTVKAKYSEAAVIPDGSTLEVYEYVQEPGDPKWREDPAYKDRPLSTERFVSADYLADRSSVLAKGLGVKDDDYLFLSKFLYVAIMSDGQEILPQAPLEVTIETNDINVAYSDAIEAAEMVYDEAIANDQQAVEDGYVAKDGATAKALTLVNQTGDKDAKTGKSAADKKAVKLQVTWEELGELALAGVAVPRVTIWQDETSEAQVLGPATLRVDAYETSASGLEEGEELLGAYVFGTDPEREYDTMLWARVIVNAGENATSSAQDSGKRYVGYALKDGAMVGSPTVFGTATSVLPFKAEDGVAFLGVEAADVPQQETSIPQETTSQGSAPITEPESPAIEGEYVLEQSLPASNGGAYIVRVAYGAESGIPEGATLQVRELSGSEYYAHRAQALEALDADQVISTRALDITILDASGNEVEPTGDVGVSITLANTVVSGNPQVVHFADDGVEVITPQQSVAPAAMGSVASSQTLDFTADEFSVYVIAYVVKTKQLVASDDNGYKITVTYNSTAGIPEDAELVVTEIKEGDEGYEDYAAQSAEVLGETAESLSFAKAFDITLIDPATGEECQPNSDVQVTVELLDTQLSDFENVDVVHFGDQPEVLASTVKGEAVEFQTDGFSVYVLTGTHAYTYIFYEPNGEVVEEATDTGFVVHDWSSSYVQMSVPTETGFVNAQTVKNGESPVVPQLADREGEVFAGWFEGSFSDTNVSFGKTAYDFNDVEITASDTIRLFARYTTYATVSFHDQYNSTLDDYPVMTSRREELVNGSATVKTSDVSATYSGSENLAFYGWSETPVQEAGASGTVIATDSSGSITISEDKDLYPIFQSYHWLSFYSAYTGSGATYIPQAAYFDNDSTKWATSLVDCVPEWEGHTFKGWFNGDLTVTDNGDGTTTEEVVYSTQITYADGTFVPGVVGTGVRLQGGKLQVTEDTTLYAKWDDVVTANYTIIVWKQKTTDPTGLADAAKSYDLVESEVKSGVVGSTVSVDSEYTTREYSGFSYSRCDDASTVDPNGYTILNVYYDRNSDPYIPSGTTHTLTFQDSVTGTSASTSLPVTYEVAYQASLLEGNDGRSFVPANPTSKREHYSFSGWYADEDCTTPVFFDKASYDAYKYNKVLYQSMPDEDLTLYAGWEDDWYLVQIDPNYGTFNGSGGTWFWETYDGDLVREYTQVTREYAPSSSGTYFYVKHDRAYYGYSGNEWDNSESDRTAFYTEDQSMATEDATFERAPGVYTYAGWYEVDQKTGAETPYDFSKYVDHDMMLKLHWKKSGVYYVSYNAAPKVGETTLSGTLLGGQDATAYADQAEVLADREAVAPTGYVFEGWRVRGDASGKIYRVGQNFTLDAEYSTTVGGKSTVFLDAVYTKAGTARIVYDPNGGTVSTELEQVDFGLPKAGASLVPVQSIADGKAAIANLVNNSEFFLSNGTGFSRNGMTLVGWSNKPVYDPDDKEAELYELGPTTDEERDAGKGLYGVDTVDPITLYAVWQVTAVWHLNTDSETAGWGGDWTEKGYVYNSEENTYSQAVYLNSAVDEPEYVPTDANGKMFRYWKTARDGTSAYDYSTNVTEDMLNATTEDGVTTKHLDLYVHWSDGIPVTVHAVDASQEQLVERTASDGWVIDSLVVGAAPVPVGDRTHVAPPADPHYLFAFAAASDSCDSISENQAITDLYYNVTEKQVYATYANGSTAPLGDNEVYFVYYQEKSRSINYDKMDSGGVLSPVDVVSTAPGEAEHLGVYDMTTIMDSASGSTPLDLVQDGTLGLQYYNFAIGDESAENAGQLHALTTAADSGGSLPVLELRNTWRGFQYSLDDGATWVNCGYAPALYVVYYTQQPTVVMIQEQTVGSSEVMGEQFNYQVVVTQQETDSTDPDNPAVTESNVFSGVYTLPDDDGNNAQSAILFYSKDGDKETIQTITVTQVAKDGFATTVDAAGKGAVEQEDRKWTYSTSAAVDAPVVTYTNAQSDKSVTVRVAMIDSSTNTIVPYNGETEVFGINPGETKEFLEALPASSFTTFLAEHPDYAFGAVLYGNDDGSVVTPKSLDVASVAFESVSGNVHDLALKDAQGNDLDMLAGYDVYYLYYPMPEIRYVKESPDGTLADVKGSLDGAAVSDDITYDWETIVMNGVTVVQGQRFSFPMKGFRITQEVGKNTFRMPAILDDGIYARYLSYTKLGAGTANDHASISDLEGDYAVENVSSELTMHLQVQDNALQWSFTGEDGDWNDFSGTPTVYVIYEERGYDLLITKSVPVDVGNNPSFTVTLSSTAITKSSYAVEGYEEETIAATPASGSKPGTITFSVTDGTSVKFKGLGQGDYTVKETGNPNYVLEAKYGPLYGTLEDVDAINNTLVLPLDMERRLDLTNNPKPVCKITVDETEIPFYTLQSAVEYVGENIPTKTATIQMLTDYLIPASDQPVIPSGYVIIINTADTSGGTYVFDGGSSGTASGATITRDPGYVSSALIVNRGTLTLAGLTLDGGNVEADSALIQNSGDVQVTEGALLRNAKNLAGNGGAICTTAGSVTITSATISNNTADKGGAIYSEGSGVSIGGTLSGNKAANGGAVYYSGTGTISVSGNLTGNEATEGNGGAIYATAGTIALTGGNLAGNKATGGNGGAIFTGSGAVRVSGGTIGGDSESSANQAVNGAAIFVDTGSVTFSDTIDTRDIVPAPEDPTAPTTEKYVADYGKITHNIATNGGAIGVGSNSARLYFAGSVNVIDNTMNGSASNVYLDKDTDAIINATGLKSDAEIGVYVPGDMTADLFKHRGEPGAKFGVYTSTDGIAAFQNDRLSGITVAADTDTRRVVWGKAVQLKIQYLQYYDNGFPQKASGSWNGDLKYGWASYYLPSNINAASTIADDIRSKGLYSPATATFACVFLDDDSSDIDYANYVTSVDWDSSENSWKFTKRDGTTATGGKLVVYFAEPAYVNIENNTGFTLSIDDLQLLDHHAINTETQAGYGYVYADNGAVQNVLNPITERNLELEPGKSIKLLFPGGLNHAIRNNVYTEHKYTVDGGFAVGVDTTTTIPVRQTGVADKELKKTDEADQRTSFNLPDGQTGRANGSTVDLIFGGEKPICKIVTTSPVSGVTVGANGEAVGIDERDADGIAYLFSSLSKAVAFANNHSLSSATVELLVDYLIPGSDLVSIHAGLNLTFTTAIGDTTEDYNYSDETSDRATISRNTDNTSSFIVVNDGTNTTSLSVQNLKFDGKNFSGDIDGGVIKTKNCAVTVSNCDFSNCIAKNGGGIYIQFDPSTTTFDANDSADIRGTLTVSGCNFTNCSSKSTTGRQGGGAIWTNARKFSLRGERTQDADGNYVYNSGVFSSCTAYDQGGAVFHCIDFSYGETYRSASQTFISECKFVNCTARAAGGMELDSHNVTANDCWFENCQGTVRNCGGLNVYIQWRDEKGNEDQNPKIDTYLTVTGSEFRDCTAATNGGGVRTMTTHTTLTECNFSNDSAGSGSNGGGIAITNTNAKDATLIDCTVTGCSAKLGGGVYFSGSANTNALLTIRGTSADTANYTSFITGNTAFEKGGGVYTASKSQLINTKIANNNITSTTVNDAGGMYVNSRTVIIGVTGASVDTTVITGNTASGGVASNLHLLSGSDASSIVVNCDLSEGSHIGVTNPGAVGKQFGTSPNSTNNWRPYGLGDPAPSKPGYYPTFVADNGSVYGIIDRSDSAGKKIIWGGPPVCKITDKDGNLLYLDAGKNYPAIFDALDSRTTGDWVSAFAVLRMANPTLYDSEGVRCPANDASYPFYVQMLVETYEASAYVTTTNNADKRTIVLTTGSSGDDSYPYRGAEGTVCTIKKTKTIAGNNLLTVRYNMKLENIVLDGGYDPDHPSTSVISTNVNDGLGGMVILRDNHSAVLTVGEGAVLQNYYSQYNGSAIAVLSNGSVVLDGGIIVNCITEANGGGIYKSGTGSLTLANGKSKISDCSAGGSGGGIYLKNGTLTISAGTIQNCIANGASGNGGGVYYESGSFTMSGGTISNCSATNGAGGGVFVGNNKTFNMSDGFIMGNSAKTRGGGIALGGNGVKLNFSRAPWISGNTCTDSVAVGNACNLELNYGANTIINTNGILNRARIGVYVTGADAGNEQGGVAPYAGHGREGEPFGTFKNDSDVSYLYGFVNDFNGLKGGLATGQNTSSDKKIYWIKIFSIEVSKDVDSYKNDSGEGFAFEVTLTGVASDQTIAEDINSTVDEPEKYGSLYFENGVATKMVVKNEDGTTKIVDLILHDGESVVGERLPAGLNYTVEELLTNDQKKAYAASLNGKIRGYVGENAESTTKNRYVSEAAFTNLRPICKITGNNDGLLYYKETVKYNWNENGTFVEKAEDIYLPAVYATLEDAFEVINNGTQTLYFASSTGSYLEHTDTTGAYRINMLTNYTMAEAETINSEKTVMVKTAGKFDSTFPHQGTGTYATIYRGDFDSASMFTANGNLILASIVLDGAKSSRTSVEAEGGIVNVPTNGKLTVQSAATLRNSKTSGDGGAVYVANGGEMTMTGGTINLNAVTGSGVGAGVYLAEGALLNISGNPNFGGTGVYPDGSNNLGVGNIQGEANRQDIYIAGYAGDDGDTSAVSLRVAGNITSGAGTIWVWVAESPHYKTLQQFATIASGVTVSESSLNAFRNARNDAVTENDTGAYLRGTRGGAAAGFVNWNGSSGGEKVILQKVTGDYDSLPGAKLTVYKENSTTAYTTGAETLENLESLESGVFWVGTLPYGTYCMHETTVPTSVALSSASDGSWWYTLTIAKDNDTGVVTVECSEQMVSRPTV